MLEHLDNVIFSNIFINLEDIEFDIVTFFSSDMGAVTIDLKKISFMMIILVKMILLILDLWLGVINYQFFNIKLSLRSYVYWV